MWLLRFLIQILDLSTKITKINLKPLKYKRRIKIQGYTDWYLFNTTEHNYFPHSARINQMLRLHILSRNIRIRIGHRKIDHLRMWIRRSNCTWKQPSSIPSFEILHGNYHICSGTYQKNFKRLRGISSVSEVYYTSTYEAKRESKWATSDTFLGVCYSHHAVPPLSGFFVCRIKLPLFELFIITTVSVPLKFGEHFCVITREYR